MPKTRDLVKKIEEIKGTFHARMGKIKDRNSKDLTEAEEIKKRWQEYTEEPFRTIQERSPWPRKPPWCGHTSRARHPGVWNQVDLRKHYYE